MVFDMLIKCYAVLDSKIADFHLAIFDIKNEGAIRQFADAVNNKETKWNRHPEDYSLWFVGEFDTEKGTLMGGLPVNLVNAVAVMILGATPQMELFENFKTGIGQKKDEVVNIN